MDPCDNCKKRQGCTERCFPKKDYDRGKRNKFKKRRKTNGKMQSLRGPDNMAENIGR